MTLDEYYNELDKTKEKSPEGMTFQEEKKWFLAEREKLRGQLEEGDLKIVLERQRRWRDKMQSSVG